MARAVEIKRQTKGTQVEQGSKGWRSGGQPDEWKVIARLTDSPNAQWQIAWEEALESMPDQLGTAWDVFNKNEREIVIWASEDSAPQLLQQLDELLDRANARCAEIVAEGERKREAQQTRWDEERAEQARLQQKLDNL